MLSTSNVDGISPLSDARNEDFIALVPGGDATDAIVEALGGDPLGLGWNYVDPSHPFQSVTGRVEEISDKKLGVAGSQVSYTDFPSTHLSHDQNFVLHVDHGYENLVSIVNEGPVETIRPQIGPVITNKTDMEVEWETGISPDQKSGDGSIFPKWVWPSVGDRVWLNGAWIYDAGHGERLDDGLLHYKSEIHPPRAIAVMRDQVMKTPDSGGLPIEVTATDLYIHGDGGLAPTVEAFGAVPTIQNPFLPYVVNPIDENFEFDIPMPPRPSPTARPSISIEDGPGNTVSVAPIYRLDVAANTVHVVIPLAGTGVNPLDVYARRITAGWVAPPPQLHHVQVELTNLRINDDMDGFFAGDGELSFFWANLNKASRNEWIRLQDYTDVNMDDLGEDDVPFSNATFDFYTSRQQSVGIRSIGFEQDGFDDLFGMVGPFPIQLGAYITQWAFGGGEDDYYQTLVSGLPPAGFNQGTFTVRNPDGKFELTFNAKLVDPILATNIGNGVLRLNMGPYAAARVYEDTTDGDESFTVDHVSTEPDGTETVAVSAFGFTQVYSGVTRIYAEGGYGHDTITLNPGVASKSELWGDFNPANPDLGPDQRGYAGTDDFLRAGTGDDALHGGGGADTFLVDNPAGTVLASATAQGLTIDGGGDPGDNLILADGGGPDFVETYSVGPGNGDGTITTTNGTVTQVIHFTGLAPIYDSVTVGRLVVNATDDPNTISIADSGPVGGADATTVSIDAFEPIHFTNKTILDVNALGGGDAITLDNPHPAAGLAGINIDAGTGDDAVSVRSVPPAIVTTVDGGSGNDTLAANIPGDFQGTLNALGIEHISVAIAGDFLGHFTASGPGNVQSIAIGGSVTPTGTITADNIDTLGVGRAMGGTVTTSGNLGTMSVGQDMSGLITVGGTLSQLTVGGGTPGSIIAGHIGTVGVAAGYGPVVLQIREDGVQRRLEAAVPGIPYPLPYPLFMYPSPTSTSPTGVTFRYFYESGALSNPQLTVRVSNRSGNTAPDQYDLSLVTWSDAAQFNLARLDAEGPSGLRNIAVEGDLLTGVTPAAADFLGAPNGPAGVRLPLDVLAGVAVRDYVPNASVQAASIQALAFGAFLQKNGRVAGGEAAHAADAANLLAPGTAIAQARDGEVLRVPFADPHRVASFVATSGNGHFDDQDVLFTDQSGLDQIGYDVRGAVTALITIIRPSGTPDRSLIRTIDLRGDGGAIQTRQPILQAITSTGPLGDLILKAPQGIEASVTAPSILGNIDATSGPIAGVIQTTGIRTEPTTGLPGSIAPAFGRIYTDTSGKVPTLAATYLHAGGGGITATGQLVSRGDLISRVIADGGIGGVIAAQGNIGWAAPDLTTRLGGVLVANGGISGRVVALGNILGDVVAHGGLKGGRIAAQGQPLAGLDPSRVGILGNVVIDGVIDGDGAIVSGGQIGDAALGTVLTFGGNQGFVAAKGRINRRGGPSPSGVIFDNIGDAGPNAAAIDAIFTDGGIPLPFDLTAGGLDLGGLTLIVQDLAALRVGPDGKLTGTRA